MDADDSLLRALSELPGDDLRGTVARVVAARVLPALLELSDDELRAVLSGVLAGRAPYERSPSHEYRLTLAVTGPPPKRKGPPAWRHRAVAVRRAYSVTRGARRDRLAYEGECPACGTSLCCDVADPVCPVCGNDCPLDAR